MGAVKRFAGIMDESWFPEVFDEGLDMEVQVFPVRMRGSAGDVEVQVIANTAENIKAIWGESFDHSSMGPDFDAGYLKGFQGCLKVLGLDNRDCRTPEDVQEGAGSSPALGEQAE